MAVGPRGREPASGPPRRKTGHEGVGPGGAGELGGGQHCNGTSDQYLVACDVRVVKPAPLECDPPHGSLHRRVPSRATGSYARYPLRELWTGRGFASLGCFRRSANCRAHSLLSHFGPCHTTDTTCLLVASRKQTEKKGGPQPQVSHGT